MTDRAARSQRRKLLGSLGAAAVVAALPVRHGHAGEYRLRRGVSLTPAHPIVAGLASACTQVAQITKRQVIIELQHSGQPVLIRRCPPRCANGDLEMVSTAGLIWGGAVPTASVSVVAFAFPDYRAVWAAMDGELGAHVRTAFLQAGLVPVGRIWDHGFRHVTSASRPIAVPQDLATLKIRVPVSPMLVSLFQGLGATVNTIPYGEMYAALKGKVVDAQENPLTVIDAARLYEVQTYCSYTARAWDGFWLTANMQASNALPEALRRAVLSVFDAHALKQRTASSVLGSI